MGTRSLSAALPHFELGLSGVHVLITGANGGIGLTTVQTFLGM